MEFGVKLGIDRSEVDDVDSPMAGFCQVCNQ